MERVERTYLIGGARVKVPPAEGGGTWCERTRYTMLSESIAQCLFVCPRSDKVLMTALQTAWAESERGLRAQGPVPDEQSYMGFDC